MSKKNIHYILDPWKSEGYQDYFLKDLFIVIMGHKQTKTYECQILTPIPDKKNYD